MLNNPYGGSVSLQMIPRGVDGKYMATLEENEGHK